MIRSDESTPAPLNTSSSVDLTPLNTSLGVDLTPLNTSPGVDLTPLNTSLGVDMIPLCTSLGVDLTLLNTSTPSPGVGLGTVGADGGLSADPGGDHNDVSKWTTEPNSTK